MPKIKYKFSLILNKLKKLTKSIVGTTLDAKPYLKSIIPCPNTRSVCCNFDDVCTFHKPGCGSLIRINLTVFRSIVPLSFK